MDTKSKQLLDAIARDLAIPKWSGEDESHWADRCLYSAAGRTALHIIWDDERPDSTGVKDNTGSPPVDGTDAPCVGSISFYHFWKSMDRFLVPASRLFGKAFGAVAQIRQPVLDDEIEKMGQAEESDWGDEMALDNSQTKKRIEQFKKWVFTLYLEAGFIRHRPMRVGPVLDSAASLGSVEFQRGSWLNVTNVHMSGLAMWTPKNHEAALIPFADLLLLPPERTDKEHFPNHLVRQTVMNLLAGTIAPITFSQMRTGSEKVTRFTVPVELPREERILLLMCSWPKDFGNLGAMSDRTCSAPLFDGIRSEMEKLGYKFSEQKDGVK